MNENQNDYYKEKEATYYTVEIGGVIFADCPYLKEWRGAFLPSSEQLLKLAEKAAKLKNTLLGISDDERNKPEIQGI